MLKNNFDIKILYNFLEKICEIKYDICNNYYVIENTSFKKLEYYNLIDNFKLSIEPYYINSKKYYISRKLDYNKFLTLIRQICKFCNIYYYNKIIYNKSKYSILYYIEIV